MFMYTHIHKHTSFFFCKITPVHCVLNIKAILP